MRDHIKLHHLRNSQTSLLQSVWTTGQSSVLDDLDMVLLAFLSVLVTRLFLAQLSWTCLSSVFDDLDVVVLAIFSVFVTCLFLAQLSRAGVAGVKEPRSLD